MDLHEKSQPARSRARRQRIGRRGTVLLMVVGMLAALFIIVSAYITLARFERVTHMQMHQGKIVEKVVDGANALASAVLRQQLADMAGDVMSDSATKSLDFTYEDLIGSNGSKLQAAIEPALDYAAAPRIAPPLAPGTRNSLMLTYPAVSSTGPFNGTASAFADSGPNEGPPAVWELMASQGYSLALPSRLFPNANAPQQQRDWEQLARRLFMDADGDGFPDSSFEHTLGLQELANAVAGRTVRAPRIRLTELNSPSSGAGIDWDDQWNRFDKFAKYEIALRVINHGGMVALDSHWPSGPAPSTSPWNRQFVRNMFNWVRAAGDPALAAGTPEDALMQSIGLAKASIEPVLRRRGGTLPSARDSVTAAGQPSARIPQAMRKLEDSFRYTFLPTHGRQNISGDLSELWQRLNVSDANERGDSPRPSGWLDSAWLDPNNAGNPLFRSMYDRRHLLTANSNSDNLARKQDIDADPTTPAIEPPPDSVGLATHQGQTKFYLGDIIPASPAGVINVARSAFIPGPGNSYLYNSAPMPGSTQSVGDRLVQRLGGLYYNMLSGHIFAEHGLRPGYPQPAPTPDQYDIYKDTSSITRRMQALMLTVNMIAFATPRDITTGRTDIVTYVDNDFTTDTYFPPLLPGEQIRRTYVGYGPQPFISQVMAYAKTDQNDDGTYSPGPGPGQDHPRVALAVELFNPNDPYVPNSGNPTDPTLDQNALDMTQFAISLNDADPNNQTLYPRGQGWGYLYDPVNPGDSLVKTMPVQNRFPGRWFTAIAIRPTGGEITFDNTVAINPNAGTPENIPPTGASGWDPVDTGANTVRLWKQASYALPAIAPNTQSVAQLGWFVVDEFTITMDIQTYVPAGTQGTPGSVPNWAADEHRECAPQSYFGGGYGQQLIPLPLLPRLPMDRRARWGVCSNVRVQNHGLANIPTFPDADDIGYFDDLAIGAPVGPATPLITMNALPGLWPSNGNVNDLRPNSFPTPGFAMFIPRFGHVIDEDLALVPTVPIVRRPMSVNLFDEWNTIGVKHIPMYTPSVYPLDFGHMPVFDNAQNVVPYTPTDPTLANRKYGYFADARAGRLPWGQLVFDYFTTLNPVGVDPMRIPGRINVNSAPWYVMAGLPVLAPPPSATAVTDLPISPTASPEFWNHYSGILIGPAPGTPRFETDSATNAPRRQLTWDTTAGTWRLGEGLAVSIAGYRDRLQYIDMGVAQPVLGNYVASSNRNVLTGTSGGVYRPGFDLRRETAVTVPRKTGLVSLGEMLNVQGFDSSFTNPAPPPPAPSTTILAGDYVKAVSLMALLDTHWLTTRSNTFTVYLSVTDRENASGSVRSQVTVDRSNTLPKLVVYGPSNPPPAGKIFGDPVLGPPEPGFPNGRPVVVKGGSTPEIISEREIGYFNATYDD